MRSNVCEPPVAAVWPTPSGARWTGWRRWAACLATGLLVPAVVQAASFAELKAVAPTPAPALAERPDGPQVLDALRGRPVVVNFWATWCEPCRDEMPALDRLRGRRPDAAFVTVAMADSRAKVEAFATDYLLDLRIVHDPDQVAGRAWGVRVLPTTLLLDAEHRIRYRGVGALDWESPAVAAALDSLKPAPGATPARR